MLPAANKNKYLHSIWQTARKGKLCVKSVGIFVNLKQQNPKPKPKAKQTVNPNPKSDQTKSITN